MRWWIYGAMLLAFAAVPAIVPTGFAVGGLQVAFYEPVLVVAAVCCLSQIRLPEYLWFRIWAGVCLLILGVLVAIAVVVPIKDTLSDARGLVGMLLAYVVAASVVGTDLEVRCLRLLRWILWWSAGLTLFASATGIPLGGRTEDASLFLNGVEQATGAARLITPATHLSLAVLCGCIGVLVTRHATFRQTLPFALPAVVIVFLSFSRNSLVAIAAVLLVALVLYARSWWGTVVTLTKAAALVGIAALFLAAGAVFLDIPAGPYLQHQVAAYATRVIDGLSSHAISSDPSVKYRVTENYYLGEAFNSAPIVGHGFGYAYKPPVGTPGWYGHDFYFWLLVKTGLVGLAVFVYWAVSPLLAIRKGPAAAVALGLAGVGLLVVSFIAPIPLGMNGSAALGAALGATAAYRARQVEQRQASGRPPVGLTPCV